MNSTSLKTQIKTVGSSGQISLGKSYAGRLLRLQPNADGSLLLTPVAVIPESQLWTLTEPHRSAITAGMAWAATHPPAETDLDALEQQVMQERRKRPHARKR